ncbi:Global transcription regulator sge1 [Mucor velutinosus]|uniref:Global transcription regulator sge1 n=1 Tax=Mucor velutinosus TaxID=708070 RepID=A0AAN7DL69_9FUNG|nr:Global transcription regulator sge1 [Mucor velutinosus]
MPLGPPSSPTRSLVNTEAAAHNTTEPYMSSYNSPSDAARSTATVESSPYQANSVHAASANVASSNVASVDQPSYHMRRTSETPPPPQLPLLQSSNSPNYSRSRTPTDAAPSNIAVPESISSNMPANNAAVPSENHSAPPNPEKSPNATATTTTTTTTAAAAAVAASNSSSGYRPLNVKDALTYLDQVKMKFADQAKVYNRFLDIMKEFKSQAIDTPGVIERVSTLFRGHPALISGFNTFLPPGYRIECSTDAYARDIIKVTTPTGTTSTTSGEPLNLHSENAATLYYSHQQQQQQQQQQRTPAPTQAYPNSSYRNAGGSLPPIATYHPSQQPLHHSQRSSVPPPSSSSAAMPSSQSSHAHRSSSPPPPLSATTTSNNTAGDDHGTRRAPVEFNHAINYVNKIKNRFSNDPETYKQFLEILQTYQKEQKPIQEVYAQVQTLFNGATDLLTEFKQFLPDTSQQAPVIESTTTLTKKTSKKQRALPLPPKQKKAKLQHHSTGGSIASIANRMDHHMITSDIRRSPLVLPPSAPVDGPIISAVEAEFFDRVRKHIGNKQTYLSFLRVLNLFTQQVLDANQLIERCESYLSGNKELYHQLKKLVGYDGKDRIIENVPLVSSKLDYGAAYEYGPSYRSVPKHWQSQKCSGRDTLCWEVLNDEYVSHPTWASEDGGFIASKKNVFEEALHRVEEERYHYDLDIEANLNTISLLEPINKKIALMTDEEKNDFKVSPGLGGPSKAIYQRVLKKIYGNQTGAEVIDMLHNSPAHAVPVVLKRLKQKDEEWRRQQREWNKVWREIESKNYYKALDYQGVIFKTNDKKNMSIKQLVNEIEAIHHDQTETQEPQLKYQLKNKKVFKDVTRVLYSYFERQTTYGHEDCAVMKAFIEMFLPVFFDVPDVLPEKEPSQDIMLDDEDEDVDDDVDGDDADDDDEDNDTQHSYDSSTDSRSTKRGYTRRNGRRSPRHKPNDEDHQKLLKDVLTKKLKSITETKTGAAEPKIQQLPAEEEEEEDVAMAYPDREQKIYNLFGNTTFYCFFRLFQVCYDRLYQMKQLDRAYRTNGPEAKALTKAALDLHVTGKDYNGVHMDFKRGYYQALLKLIDRYFDDAFDQTMFEECARYIFGNKAYVLFTIDKLMQSIMRQLHQIVTDMKAQKILSFFKKNHEHEKSTPELIQAYRSEVADALGQDDKLYNLAFDTLKRTLYIQLLQKQDRTFGLNDMDVYTDYVAHYTNWDVDTPGIDRKALSKRFLSRNIVHQADTDFTVKSSLEYKICRSTYHLFYVTGEDAFVRWTSPQPTALDNDTVSRNFAWKSWLDREKDTTELDSKTRSLFT